MSEMRGWSVRPLPEQHLMPDAVVAFVDGELSMTARDRAARHIANCPMCAGDTAVQRQARSAVRTAETPSASAGLLAALRNIPVDTDLPSTPDCLAVTEDGQLVAVQRPDRAAAALGAGPMLGSSKPLGAGANVLNAGGRSWHGRRAVQGAGMVAAGLVLGALVMVGPHVLGSSPSDQNPEPGEPPTPNADVIQANFATPLGGAVRATQPTPTPAVSTSPAVYHPGNR